MGVCMWVRVCVCRSMFVSVCVYVRVCVRVRKRMRVERRMENGEKRQKQKDSFVNIPQEIFAHDVRTFSSAL